MTDFDFMSKICTGNYRITNIRKVFFFAFRTKVEKARDEQRRRCSKSKSGTNIKVCAVIFSILTAKQKQKKIFQKKIKFENEVMGYVVSKIEGVM